jgi:hypothetical protein
MKSPFQTADLHKRRETAYRVPCNHFADASPVQETADIQSDGDRLPELRSTYKRLSSQGKDAEAQIVGELIASIEARQKE